MTGRFLDEMFEAGTDGDSLHRPALRHRIRTLIVMQRTRRVHNVHYNPCPSANVSWSTSNQKSGEAVQEIRLAKSGVPDAQHRGAGLPRTCRNQMNQRRTGRICVGTRA